MEDTQNCKKTVRGVPFKKGDDPRRNLGGRPVLPEDLKKLCQAKGEEAIKTALEIMDDSEQPAVARLKAAEILLDRGYGKASQHIEAEVKGDPIVCVEIVKSNDG